MQNPSAPWFTLPRVPIVGIEHPYMISDIGKAVDTLGGPLKTSTLVGGASASIEADLHFHPGDRNSKPVASFNTKTSNILLKITVPKRTGLKRKRGSDDVWQESSQAPPPEQLLLSDPEDARRLVRSLRDNPDRYRIEPVASIAQTHRFRHPRLKEFRFDMSKGIQRENDLIPPPIWTRQMIPYNYSYRQNPSLKQSYTSNGVPTLRNTQAARRNMIFVISHDAPSVPTEPHSELAPESTLAPPLQALLGAMRDIFAQRPVGTRRSVQNQVPPDIWKAVGPHAAKQLWQYVGFLWNSGPWRDAICAFGVDPRKDKEMRRYQTVVFQFEPEPTDSRADHTTVTKSKIDRGLAAKGEIQRGHLFDGETVCLDGKVWQICDISDPLLKSMLDTKTLRDECDTFSDGWYTNGTWAKLKVVMKAKISAILAGAGNDMQLENELLRLHQKIPDVLNEKNRSQAIFDKGSVPSRMVKWAELVRTTATRPGGRGVAWGPETAKKKADVPKVSHAKKTAVPGRGRGRGFGGGRPRKQVRGGRTSRLNDHSRPSDGQDLIDPRLRDITGDVEDVARDLAMRAFEDDVESSSDEGSNEENSDLGASDVESSDEDNTDEEDPDTEESAVSDVSQDSEAEEDEASSASE
ncbi:MAG: hypothetical protein LQ338_002810 [Usnochroma carphineum]|nr:MAG: hypothetical protein LQ338_002810 [Usnochroma carphineum]